MTVPADSQVDELPVSFEPGLYLQRRGWVLDMMRRERVVDVLDVGCAEGELLGCLCNPAPWLAQGYQRSDPAAAGPGATALPDFGPDTDWDKDIDQRILHPVRVAGLDVSVSCLECTIDVTAPPSVDVGAGAVVATPPRWEPLDVSIWKGSLARFNPVFVGVECIVATEVIEHLPEPVLARFAPTLFGAYAPRVLLVTTPSYTFNARFTAPDAPPGARGGFRDPTGRTDRVFRHHDHRFEWTVEEFGAWCEGVAREWGYVVEIGGVGRAAETDPWGRDEALGWASQVACFTRIEGEAWRERRTKMAREMNVQEDAEEAHELLVTHRYGTHPTSRKPEALDAIGELVTETMIKRRTTSVRLADLWWEEGVGAACGGWMDCLVLAVHAQPGLRLENTGAQSFLTIDRWLVHLDPDLHHLILPESKADIWSASPESSEESWEAAGELELDEDWNARWDEGEVHDAAEDVQVEDGETWTDGSIAWSAWGEPEPEPKDGLGGHGGWGADDPSTQGWGTETEEPDGW